MLAGSGEEQDPHRDKGCVDEAVELAKVYGGTDGHKYVNGVLDKLAPDLRPGEAAARKSKA